MIQLEWTEPARSDFLGICDHIATDNPATAERIGQTVLTAVERLAEMPRRGRPGRVGGTRELVIPSLPYVVVYAVQGRSVVVLRVLHGAQSWPESGSVTRSPRVGGSEGN